jgi:hypothetical protein
MKNTFILYVFDIIKLYIFNNIFDQTLSSLTKSRIQGKNEEGVAKIRLGMHVLRNWKQFHRDCAPVPSACLTRLAMAIRSSRGGSKCNLLFESTPMAYLTFIEGRIFSTTRLQLVASNKRRSNSTTDITTTT